MSDWAPCNSGIWVQGKCVCVCLCVNDRISKAEPAEITRKVLKAHRQVERPGRNNKIRIYCLVACRRRERPIQSQSVPPPALVLPSTFPLPALLPPPSAARSLAAVWKGVVKKPFKHGIQNPPFHPSPCLLISFQLSILLETPAGFSHSC